MDTYAVPAFHHLTPSDEINNRIARFSRAVSDLGLNAALLFDPINIFYFSGTMPAGQLLVPANAPPVVLIRRNLDRPRAESPLLDIRGITGLTSAAREIEAHLTKPPQKLGLEMDVLPINMFERLRRIWPDAQYLDISPAIMDIRAVKSDYEIDMMRQTGKLAQTVYERIPELLVEGITEIELAGRIDLVSYRGGHQNYLRMRSFDQEMYTWHVISGVSGGARGMLDASHSGYGLSPAFPKGASMKAIQKGEPVLIDYGLCLNGYQVDLTRMFSIGAPPAEALDAYDALGEIESAMLRQMNPGATGEELHHLAVREADQLGFGHAFLGPQNNKVKFSGHGVGLEVNEPPVMAPGFTKPFVPNMTVALELKMVFPGKYAIGRENTYVVTGETPELLTTADDRFIQV
jgi:Xaa-Pro dipeptidase